MTTDVIKTIGLTGRNYATLQAFFDAIPADLVAADQRWIGEVYNDGKISVAVKQRLTGKTTDATRNVILRPATGQGFKDHSGRLTNSLYFNAAYGAAIESSVQYDDAFVFDAPFTEMYGLQFNSTAVEATNTILSTGLNCKIQGNIILGKSPRIISMQADNLSVINNVIVALNTNCIGVATNYAANGIVQNNDIVAPGSSTQVGISSDAASGLFNNNNIFGFTSAAQAGTGSNNATSAASFPFGSSNLVGKVFSTEFVSATNLRLKSTSSLVGAGVAISGLTTDILGQTLASPPSIGAFQYVAPVADTTAPTMTGTMTSSGVTASGYTLDWSGTTRADNVGIAGFQHSVDGSTWTDSGNVTSRSFTGKAASTLYPNYVRAYDAATPPNVSTPALLLNVTTAAPSGDTTAPNLSGSITQGAFTSTSSQITWPAATDNVAVDHYEVSKDSGSTWTVVAAGTLTYNFTGLTPSTAYGQRVRALDAAGNVSAVLALAVTTSAASTNKTYTSTKAMKRVNGTLAAGVSLTAIVSLLDGTYLGTKTGVVTNSSGIPAPFTVTFGSTGTATRIVWIEESAPTNPAPTENVTPT